MIEVKSFSRKEIIYEAIGRTVSVFSAISLTYTLMILHYPDFIGTYKCKDISKEFQGKAFTIQVCEGARIYEDSSSWPVRLSVFDEQNRLRAVRYFVSHDDRDSRASLIGYREDRLTYFFFDTGLTMPPTALDWLRARIPFTDIGQFEQMWY